MTLDVMSAGRLLIGVGAVPGSTRRFWVLGRCRDGSAQIGSRSSSRCSTCCCDSHRPPGRGAGSRPSRRGRSPGRRNDRGRCSWSPGTVRAASDSRWVPETVGPPTECRATRRGRRWRGMVAGVAEAVRRLEEAAQPEGSGRVPPGARHGLRDGRPAVVGADAGPARTRGGAGLHRRCDRLAAGRGSAARLGVRAGGAGGVARRRKSSVVGVEHAEPPAPATLSVVLRTGSFAAAGRHLGYTGSAVSQQMKALEAESGLVLFERGAHGGSRRLRGSCSVSGRSRRWARSRRCRRPSAGSRRAPAGGSVWGPSRPRARCWPPCPGPVRPRLR